MANPRNEAVKLLCKIEKDASYSALTIKDALKDISFDDKRDTAFAVSLIYGVLENKLTIDYNISLYLNSGFNKLKPVVLNILRSGAYQILYLDKIPASAAVNESVKLSKKMSAAYASGLINAVLRKIATNGLLLPEKTSVDAFFSVKYSVDNSIISSLIADYGKKCTEQLLNSFAGRRPIFIRTNLHICEDDTLLLSLSIDGVIVKKTALEHCFSVEETGDITALDAFRRGLFYVQDMSSQLCCSLLGAKAGDKVVDCCAAPGGKSFTISQYVGKQGSVLSCDMYEHKTKLIKDTAERLAINNLSTICCDARELKTRVSDADCVLCDVPCSGFGVMGRKPEIRYKNADELKSLPSIQKEILYSCCDIVKQGGTLIYSTCTLNKNENDRICDEFLSSHPDFSIADDATYRKLTDRYITIFPTPNGGDGFFIAKFIRGNK